MRIYLITKLSISEAAEAHKGWGTAVVIIYYISTDCYIRVFEHVLEGFAPPPFTATVDTAVHV